MVKLNNKLPVVALATMTTKVRMAKFLGKCTWVAALRAGAACSGGAQRANQKPQAMDTTPGTTKAMRQPKYLTSKPVDKAAKAMPKLPDNPLMPMVRPGVGEFCTNSGMPTGW